MLNPGSIGVVLRDRLCYAVDMMCFLKYYSCRSCVCPSIRFGVKSMFGDPPEVLPTKKSRRSGGGPNPTMWVCPQKCVVVWQCSVGTLVVLHDKHWSWVHRTSFACDCYVLIKSCVVVDLATSSLLDCMTNFMMIPWIDPGSGIIILSSTVPVVLILRTVQTLARRSERFYHKGYR